MILLDTSVWVDHLRRSDSLAVAVLESGQATAHAFVIGELACGNLKSRAHVIELLQALPQLAMATDDEVLYFIERHKLMGRGIGYVDAHLLAAAAIGGSFLWTRDKRLREIATELGVAYVETDQ
ncbi:MAG: type II toxin-antitoxin system VapC family toxin [Burkholderiales bacterium]|nr:type II toxin-antitoxin system VapC family toxin [Burkholderiales bacterium]